GEAAAVHDDVGVLVRQQLGGQLPDLAGRDVDRPRQMPVVVGVLRQGLDQLEVVAAVHFGFQLVPGENCTHSGTILSDRDWDTEFDSAANPVPTCSSATGGNRNCELELERA